MHLKYSVFFQALTVNAHDNCFHAGEQWNNILILTLKERLVTEKRDFNYFLKKKQLREIMLFVEWSFQIQ